MTFYKPEQHSLLLSIFQSFNGLQVKIMHQYKITTNQYVPNLILSLPMCQAWACGPVCAAGPTTSAPKQWKSDVHIKS